MKATEQYFCMFLICFALSQTEYNIGFFPTLFPLKQVTKSPRIQEPIKPV